VPCSAECECTFNPRFCLTLCHQVPLSWGLVRRTLPFRNARIISVLRERFFTGGSMLFVNLFSRIFTIQDGISPVRREVPLPMVCLVATGVSWKSNVFLNSALMFFFYSYMPPFTSGRRARNNTWNSPQVHS